MKKCTSGECDKFNTYTPCEVCGVREIHCSSCGVSLEEEKQEALRVFTFEASFVGGKKYRGIVKAGSFGQAAMLVNEKYKDAAFFTTKEVDVSKAEVIEIYSALTSL